MSKTLLVCELDQYALLVINYVVGTVNSRGKAPHYMQVRKKERKKEREKERERKKERKKERNKQTLLLFTQAFNTSTVPTFDSICDAMCCG